MILSGAAHVLDLGTTSAPVMIVGSGPLEGASLRDLDGEAMLEDWIVVGKDLRSAMEFVDHGQGFAGEEAATGTR